MNCCSPIDRRTFIKSSATLTAAASMGAFPVFALSSPYAGETPEKLVGKFYESLTAEQKTVVALPWKDKRRTRVANNWNIVKPTIGKFFTQDQKAILADLFKGLLTEDGHDRFERSMKDDAGGFENYHCCIFGKPGTKQFEWVLTGRHVTIRCDGDTTKGVAFGGPIFYGHAVEFFEKPDHKGNVWWHEARLANTLFAALDGKQREKALVEKAPADTPASIKINPDGPFDGIAVGDLSKDQKELAEKVVKRLLSAYRKTDVEEAMTFIKTGGGFDKVHVSFYKGGNLGDDEIWDNWRIQSPTMSWNFRGSPHVHTWVNISGQDTD